VRRYILSCAAAGRSRIYLYHIVEELEKRGLPTELALLPMEALEPRRSRCRRPPPGDRNPRRSRGQKDPQESRQKILTKIRDRPRFPGVPGETKTWSVPDSS